jgi:hypothetical protein
MAVHIGKKLEQASLTYMHSPTSNRSPAAQGQRLGRVSNGRKDAADGSHAG